ncbi:peptidase inhibitor family I36 protein [Sphaerisporangium corydalis]|uniref:Peptidase inhibitor family I36 protein n=1 Tax=Sphaerisporangium corydalis TaxID=1441875 RepID=A0ABV9E7F0_9ACTN|nr:peptidase inhibitor family I36 protein [Sphaerisporangium corydalis]
MTTQQFTTETRRNVERFLAFSEHVGELHEQEVLDVLREQGITTLESLIRHTLSAPRSAAPVPAEPAWPGAASASEGSVHRPPSMAVVVDGVEHAPEDLRRFDGQPLHFVASRGAGGEPRLLAFTDDQPLRTALWVSSLLREQERATSAASASAPFTKGQVQMFQHHNFDGDWFWLSAGFGYNDLTRVYHGPIWSRSDWNDTISSISATDCNVTYYEHINWGGSSFFSPAYTGNPADGHAWGDLGSIGWNDRISSVANWGVPR